MEMENHLAVLLLPSPHPKLSRPQISSIQQRCTLLAMGPPPLRVRPEPMGLPENDLMPLDWGFEVALFGSQKAPL